MAFSKMDGLEVIPRSPSSSISCFSSPDAIIPRRMKSIQMLWPQASSFSKGFSFICHSFSVMSSSGAPHRPWDKLIFLSAPPFVHGHVIRLVALDQILWFFPRGADRVALELNCGDDCFLDRSPNPARFRVPLYM